MLGTGIVISGLTPLYFNHSDTVFLIMSIVMALVTCVQARHAATDTSHFRVPESRNASAQAWAYMYMALNVTSLLLLPCKYVPFIVVSMIFASWVFAMISVVIWVIYALHGYPAALTERRAAPIVGAMWNVTAFILNTVCLVRMYPCEQRMVNAISQQNQDVVLSGILVEAIIALLAATIVLAVIRLFVKKS